MSVVSRKLFSGSKKVKKPPEGNSKTNTEEGEPKSSVAQDPITRNNRTSTVTSSDADGTDRLSPAMLPSEHSTHLSHHASLTGKDTLPLPDSDVVTRSRSLKTKRLSDSSDGGTRPASIAVFGSPHSIRRSSKTGSSTSLNSDCVDAPIVNHEEILQLTRDVRTFSESLSRLKLIFNQDGERTESLRVLAHDKLRDLLNILRSILDKYSALRSTDVHTAAVLLITQIKSLKDESEEERIKLFEAIDQLALAFSSSVTEYLMGDVEQGSINMGFPSSKSYDSLSSVTTSSDGGNVYSRQMSQDSRESACLSASELDDTLMHLDAGLDLALDRAKVWSKYAKDVICYVEKRTHLETEFARSIAKLAVTTRPTLKEETYLPFQSTYLTALEHDLNYVKNCDTTHQHIQGHKFVEQLEARRADHDKKRKHIRQTWNSIKKEMHERKTNMEKCQQQYVNRCQEYEKIRESAAKMETEILNTSSGTNASKLEKKKKAEEEALMKAKEAETTYKACIVEANAKRLDMAAVKKELLVKLRELIYQCDQTMKAVTVSYFQLQHSLSAPAPVQFQTLCEQSRCYEPGVQFSEFVRHYKPRVKGHSSRHEESFVFEPYGRFDRPRKPSSHSLDSQDDERFASPSKHGHSRTSSSPDRTDKSKPVHAWGGTAPAQASDSDSMSGSSTKSVDASPSASPMNGHRNLNREVSTGTMSSGDELVETDDSRQAPSGTKLIESVPNSFRNLAFSKAAHTHLIRKLRTPSKCRECDSYVYFNGAECERCGLACHKKCLESLAIQCGGKRLMGRMNVFGVPLRDHLKATNRDAPFLVTKCSSEIDTRALHVKGVYRVAGLKVKVEKLCQTFENGLDLVDLSETPPHLITSVFKLYFRQLPEPLMTFKHYPEFISLAKEFPRSVPESAEEEERLITKLRSIVNSMPEENFQTLRVLMHHLKGVSENEDFNQMTASNLGIVFGPTLLRPNDNTASLSALVDMPHQTRAIEMLILYAQVFGHRETQVEQLQPEPRTSSPLQSDINHGSINYSPNKSTNNSTHMATAPVETVTAGSRAVPGFVLPGSSEDSGDILPCLAADVNSGEEGDGDSSGNEGGEEASASEDQFDSDQDASPLVPRRSPVPKCHRESSPQPIKQTLLAVASEYHKTQLSSSLPETVGQLSDAAGQSSSPAGHALSDSSPNEGYIPSAYSQNSPQRSSLMTDGPEVTVAGSSSIAGGSNSAALSSTSESTEHSGSSTQSVSRPRSNKSRQPQFV